MMKIERTSKADFDEILGHLEEFWGERGKELGPVHHPVYFYEFGDTAYAIHHAGRVVAYLFGFVSQTSPTAYVHLIGVHRDYRRQGMGRRLYDHFLLEVMKRGCTKVKAMTQSVNSGSIAFHQSLGMKLLGSPNEQGILVIPNYRGPGQDRVVFEMELKAKRPGWLNQPTLESGRILLRPLGEIDPSLMLDYFSRNQKHFGPYFTLTQDELTSEVYWQGRRVKALAEFQCGMSVNYTVVRKEASSRIIGNINFSQIFRGKFHACYLGYGIDAEEEGQGIMREGLELAIRYIFEVQNLHRIMANHLPDNLRSASLLKRLGFVTEGEAKEYLLINRKWRDHVLTSLTNRNWHEAEGKN